MNKTALAIEKLRKDAKFAIRLGDQQTGSLVEQCKPFQQIVEQLQNEIATIRVNKRLSYSAIHEDVRLAKERAVEQVTRYYDTISRQAVVVDLQDRLVSAVATKRRGNAEAMQNAAGLATELRQHVLPRLIAQNEANNIPATQTVSKLAVQAAERYSTDPTKMETILNALQIGWPFNETLTDEAKSQVEAIVSAQVAPDEMKVLRIAKAVSKAISSVAEATIQECRELG
ncbi:MAG: hypothetical protein RBT36_09320 [Desulfobulbus sp.]|jgi:hypothetical protein|nr:hypothetical protein [Desulfobulbus sp.]